MALLQQLNLDHYSKSVDIINIDIALLLFLSCYSSGSSALVAIVSIEQKNKIWILLFDYLLRSTDLFGVSYKIPRKYVSAPIYTGLASFLHLTLRHRHEVKSAKASKMRTLTTNKWPYTMWRKREGKEDWQQRFLTRWQQEQLLTVRNNPSQPAGVLPSNPRSCHTLVTELNTNSIVHDLKARYMS